MPLGRGCTHSLPEGWGAARSGASFGGQNDSGCDDQEVSRHLLNTYCAPDTPHASLFEAKKVSLTQSEGRQALGDPSMMLPQVDV